MILSYHLLVQELSRETPCHNILVLFVVKEFVQFVPFVQFEFLSMDVFVSDSKDDFSMFYKQAVFVKWLRWFSSRDKKSSGEGEITSETNISSPYLTMWMILINVICKLCIVVGKLKKMSAEFRVWCLI